MLFSRKKSLKLGKSSQVKDPRAVVRPLVIDHLTFGLRKFCYSEARPVFMSAPLQVT